MSLATLLEDVKDLSCLTLFPVSNISPFHGWANGGEGPTQYWAMQLTGTEMRVDFRSTGLKGFQHAYVQASSYSDS